MITVDVWETIRIRCRRDGEKIKPVARDLGVAPNTVRKYLRQIDPPSRKPRPRTSSLERYRSHIDGLILSTPKITAARIGSYLRQNVDADLAVDDAPCAITWRLDAQYLFREKRSYGQRTHLVISRNLIFHPCRSGWPG